MGEKQNQPFQLFFNPSLKVDFQGSRVTSDGGLILVRELDERLGLEKLIEEHLRDSRQAVPVTIEQKQRVVADRFEVPVVGAALLLTVNRTLAGVHVEYDAVGAIKRLGLPERLPVQRHQPDQILFPGQQLGLEPVQGRGQRRPSVPDPLRADQS